jgi:hypothetical protein
MGLGVFFSERFGTRLAERADARRYDRERVTSVRRRPDQK